MELGWDYCIGDCPAGCYKACVKAGERHKKRMLEVADWELEKSKNEDKKANHLPKS